MSDLERQMLEDPKAWEDDHPETEKKTQTISIQYTIREDAISIYEEMETTEIKDLLTEYVSSYIDDWSSCPEQPITREDLGENGVAGIVLVPVYCDRCGPHLQPILYADLNFAVKGRSRYLPVIKQDIEI